VTLSHPGAILAAGTRFAIAGRIWRRAPRWPRSWRICPVVRGGERLSAAGTRLAATGSS